jgi:hypothetical protein
MSAAADIRTFVLADATVASLIGTRMYPLNLPQAPTFPAITYQWISGQHVQSINDRSGLSGPRVQFTAWAITYLQAEAVFEALRKRLDGFNGMAGSTRIYGAILESERDILSERLDPEPTVFGRSADFFVWHQET